MILRRLLRLPRPALLLAALGALGSAPGAAAADVEFVRVWPEWHAAVDFTRISEYFDHQENLGDREVRRSHPKDRAGFYFFTRVKHPNVSLLGAKFVLRIVTPNSPDPVQYTFPAAVGPASTCSRSA